MCSKVNCGRTSPRVFNDEVDRVGAHVDIRAVRERFQATLTPEERSILDACPEHPLSGGSANVGSGVGIFNFFWESFLRFFKGEPIAPYLAKFLLCQGGAPLRNILRQQYAPRIDELFRQETGLTIRILISPLYTDASRKACRSNFRFVGKNRRIVIDMPTTVFDPLRTFHPRPFL